MSLSYYFFGLSIKSNVEIPGFPADPDQRDGAACEVLLGTTPSPEIASLSRVLTYTSSYKDPSGRPALRIWSLGRSDFFHLVYTDGHEFWFDNRCERVWGIWPSGSDLQEASEYLLGPVLGILLRHRGVVCLHASSVVIGERAVAFLGPPGAGKSTVAAALAQRGGHSVLADDITAVGEIDGTFYAYPAYPGLWLWPDSVELLYGPRDDRPKPIREGDKARIFANNELAFEVQPLPLARIYILDYRSRTGEVSTIESVTQENFLSLVANTYATGVLDAEMRAHEFSVLGKVASQVPIVSLPCMRGTGKLQDWIDTLDGVQHSGVS